MLCGGNMLHANFMTKHSVLAVLSWNIGNNAWWRVMGSYIKNRTEIIVQMFIYTHPASILETLSRTVTLEGAVINTFIPHPGSKVAFPSGIQLTSQPNTNPVRRRRRQCTGLYQPRWVFRNRGVILHSHVYGQAFATKYAHTEAVVWNLCTCSRIFKGVFFSNAAVV